MTKRKRRVFGALFALLFTGAFLFAYRAWEIHVTDQLSYEVYSAYIMPLMTGNSHDLGLPRGTILIQRESPRILLSGIPYASSRLRDSGHVLRAKFILMNLLPARIDSRFKGNAEYVVLPGIEFEQFLARYKPGDARYPYGHLVLSRVAFSRDRNDAIFYIEHACGMCGGGRFVLMQRDSNGWTVANEWWTWIS